MLFELDADQAAIVDAVAAILARRAGPARVRELGGSEPAYDHDLAAALTDQGFVGFAFGEAAGPLEAALVVEAIARAAGTVAAGSAALIVPGAVPGESLPNPVAMAVHGSTAPVRFAPDAACALVAGLDDAWAMDLRPGDVERCDSGYGYPMGRLPSRQGRLLPPGSAARLRSWWGLSVAVEIAGTLTAMLEMTTAYVRDRHQFGRPIGSFQGVQHRLAQCAVVAEGARWLALEAAWSGAARERVATALCEALRAAQLTFAETHQFSGAFGFTEEYDLHLWSMRLPALRAEALQLGSPAEAIAVARWVSG